MNYMLTRGFHPALWNRGFQERCSQRMEGREEYRSFDVDVVERDTEFVLTADLPGFDAEEVSISLERNFLKIEAIHPDADTPDANENEVRSLYRERFHGKRERSFILSESSDTGSDSVQASMDKGILTVTVQKKEKAKPLNIQVKRK